MFHSYILTGELMTISSLSQVAARLAGLHLAIIALTLLSVRLDAAAQSKPPEEQPLRQIENYYLMFGIGYPINSYPTDTKAAIDNLKAEPSLSRLPVAGEIGS